MRNVVSSAGGRRVRSVGGMLCGSKNVKKPELVRGQERKRCGLWSGGRSEYNFILHMRRESGRTQLQCFHNYLKLLGPGNVLGNQNIGLDNARMLV